MVADLLEDRHTFNILWKNVDVTRAREQEHVSVFDVREQVHIRGGKKIKKNILN